MPTVEELHFCAKYPFSNEARAYVEKNPPAALGDLLLTAKQRVLDAFDRARMREGFLSIKDSRSETFLKGQIFSYPLARIIVALAEDSRIKREWAYAEAGRVDYFLQLEQDKRVAEKLGEQIFSLEANESGYSVPFYEYIRYPIEGKHRLVNMPLENGRVLIDHHALCSLVGRHVFRSVMETKVDKKTLPDKSLIAIAADVKKEKGSSYKVEYGPVEFQYFPPCFKKIYYELRAGEKVGHMPRFSLVTFLINIGMKEDEIVEVFRNQPNFNESKTRYHVSYAAGTKGTTKYSVPSCTRLQGYGLCCADATCIYRHPLTYYSKYKERGEKRTT